MATDITVTRLREYLTTSESDAVLQTYLDAAIADIEDALGPLAVVERITPRGGLIMLGRKAASITTVVENEVYGAVTLAANDYALSSSGRVLSRLSTGTHPGYYWKGRVAVTYVRWDSPALRLRATVDLVNLDLAVSPGVASESIGTWSETYLAPDVAATQRSALLDALRAGQDIIL